MTAILRGQSLSGVKHIASDCDIDSREEPPDPAMLPSSWNGNGRWRRRAACRAASVTRPVSRQSGRTVRAAVDLGIDYLTIFAFSSENWSRPPSEVRDLFGLMKLFVTRDLAELCANGVRIRVLGDREGLSSDILRSDRYGRKQVASQHEAQSKHCLQLRRAKRITRAPSQGWHDNAPMKAAIRLM